MTFSNCVIAFSERPELSESLSFLFMGFGIVIGALMFLAVVTGIVGKFFAKLPEKQAVQSSGSTPLAEEEVDTALIAAITAAARTVIDEPFVVRSVAPIKSNASWSDEGRRQIQSSHQVR